MAAENNSKFWQLTFDYFKKDIKKPEDNLMILVHWLLLDNEFQVLGPGDENKIDDNELSTDVLHTNWSLNDTYKLRYVRDKKLFLLNGVKVGESLVLNLMNVTTKKLSSAALGNISATVEWVNDMAKNKDSFFETVSLLLKGLIDPMKEQNNDKKAVSTQTQLKQSQNNSEQPEDIHHSYNMPRYLPRNPFPSYGMPDLDPLGGLHNPGGGMIYDPMRVGSGRTGILPGVPPSARFDPIMPGGGGFRRPNPDHMRPPDFDDNLYM